MLRNFGTDVLENTGLALAFLMIVYVLVKEFYPNVVGVPTQLATTAMIVFMLVSTVIGFIVTYVKNERKK